MQEINMSVESKAKIYKTCVRSVMTCSVETIAENALTHIRTLRSMVGCSRLDRVRSDDIRTKCDVQDVVRLARKKRQR